MKVHKPTTPGRRGMSVVSYKKLTKKKPLKSLTKGVKRSVGRNSAGRITTRHKGGGHKRRYREIDFKYNKKDVPAKVETIEYDPNRSGFIAILLYADGERRYTLLPQSIEVGDTVITSENAELKPGNRMPLKKVPVGTFVYNVELKPEGGSKIARSAGNYAEVIAIDGGFAHLKMPSSEVRKVSDKAWASIGEVSNEEHKLVNIGKAGRARHMGRRPTVRGAAMNPVDHPHGGGEGKAGRGHRRARSKWGKPTGKGQKTRRSKKYSNSLIVRRRKVGKRR
ncbi:MAG: 50S ribosomal protein L2 [Candidatus Pacebacteria bacterium]|jgi:large subunit ribosomal protein L2|nr:50S ribosomal protein L2 [bacterium]MDP6527310.1 50S ribosomal protein L2 [Candidatus Paceibacterota bacterium]MDP6659412.1 50S ribosomal protein L2 [Candidatus Paceibacterota bacterium]|tara:strand:- start:18941 stop:19780 length:840 start_codon:yes stop_codon:yes gene_type:complete